MKSFRLMLVSAGLLVLCSCTPQGSRQTEAVADSVSVSQVNPVVETMMSRRSIRKYKPEAVEREKMQTIIECGINAPNGMNKQSWEIRVVDNPEFINSGFTFRLFSAELMVTGSVAAELLVNRAISTAGDIAFSTFSGFSPRAIRNSGSTTKNCIRLPPNITATYLPSEPTIMPAVTCAASCAANATTPNGNAQIKARIKA